MQTVEMFSMAHGKTGVRTRVLIREKRIKAKRIDGRLMIDETVQGWPEPRIRGPKPRKANDRKTAR